MRKGLIIGIVFLIIVLIVLYYYYNRYPKNAISKSISSDGTEKIITYRLPTSMDTEVFGPPTWKAIHHMSSEIPCSICRNEWESFTIFSHDYKNFVLKKPIFNEENFDKWLNKLCNIQKERTEKEQNNG